MKLARRTAEILILVLIVGVNLFVWQRRDNIGDWLKLRDYTAPSDVSALAVNTTMTDYGKRLFYVNYPRMDDRAAFNQACVDKSEQTTVLGCYHGNRQGIFLYAVTDQRLNGVREVTAAHEMLHQAYDRLSEPEKKDINAKIEALYDTLDDKGLRDKVDSYRKQGADVSNELHSIMGTEIRNLTPEIETYYKRYFSDRAKIVRYNEAYQSEFTRRENQVKAYDSQLTDLQSKIAYRKSNLEAQLKVIKQMAQQLKQYNSRQDPAGYNAMVDKYNQKVSAYNAELEVTRKLVNEYNRIVDARNAIAFEEKQLQQALDSQLNSSQTAQ